MPATKSVYEKLKSVEVDKLVKKKGRFNYLSWADAVDQLLTLCPDSVWEIHEYDGAPYMATPAGGFVKVTMTVGGISRTQVHPILDHNNKTIPPDHINAFDVNTAIQRCLAKAISLHGLGIDIYRGEDINHLSENTPAPQQAPFNGKPDDRLVTEKQQKRMFAIAKEQAWEVEHIKELLGSYGFSSSNQVTREHYEEICNTLEEGPDFYLKREDEFGGIEDDQIPFPDDVPNLDDYRPGF